MSNEKVSVLNLETGEHGWIRRKWFESSAINKGVLVEVDPDQKSYVPELWKSKIEDDEIRPFRDDSIVVSAEDDAKAYDEFLAKRNDTDPDKGEDE